MCISSRIFLVSILSVFAGPAKISLNRASLTLFTFSSYATLELLEPTSGDSPIAKFIEKRGEGIHHICLRVDSIDTELANLKAKGYRLVNESAVPGAHGCRVAFLHPAAANGVLVELSETYEEHATAPEDDVEAIL